MIGADRSMQIIVVHSYWRFRCCSFAAAAAATAVGIAADRPIAVVAAVGVKRIDLVKKIDSIQSTDAIN